MRLASARSAPREGVAAVELAVVLPLFLLLLLGVWEVGRMVEISQLLNNAAREGGRQASTGVKTADEVRTVVANYLNQNGIASATASDVTVTNLTKPGVDPSQASQLDQFRVTVQIPFDSVRWAILDQITKVKTLSASVDWYSMRDIPITVDSTIPLN